MKIRFAALSAVLAAGLALAGPATAAYEITGTAVSRSAGLVRTELTVRASPAPLDRFKVVRLVKQGPAGRLRGAIFLLPPLGTTFSFYEQRDPSNAVGTSIAEFFALRNYAVFGVSPRFEGIPATACEVGLADCSVMAGWNLQSMVEDAAFARTQIDAFLPGAQVLVGGASLGSILAIAVANDAPTEYDGLILWEGMLYSRNAQVRAMNQGYCSALEGQIAAGAHWDGVTSGVFKLFTQLADTTPGGLTPIPVFPPNLTNHQVMVSALSTPTPGPVSMPVPNYVQMNGSAAEDRLFNASEARVFDDIRRFNNYIPTVLVRDVSCSLAGVESRYTDALASFHAPILAIGGGRGFGPYMGDQLALFGSGDKTFLLKPGFGHIDHFMSPRHRELVEEPILRFAQRVLR
jgi:pimeloyl-ACP methyl ester carboxylesterase